jgi:hypothetical protein
LLHIALAALTASCRTQFAGSQTVILQEPGNEDVAVVLKAPPGEPAFGSIGLNGHAPMALPPDRRIIVRLNPPSIGPQTVVLQEKGRTVEISLKPPAPEISGAVSLSPPQDSPTALAAQCEQAAALIRSQGLITPRNAKNALWMWKEWKNARRESFEASPRLQGAYKEVVVAIRMHTAGDPH